MKHFELSTINTTRNRTPQELLILPTPASVAYGGNTKTTAILAFPHSSLACGGALIYTSWLFGGCSAAGLDGMSKLWGYIWTEDQPLADLLECLQILRKRSGYDPKRIFIQMPVKYDGEEYYTPMWQKWKSIFPNTEPVYTFENRAHTSCEQRLYDFDMRIADKWLKDYHAKQIQNVPVVDSTALPSGMPPEFRSGDIFNQPAVPSTNAEQAMPEMGGTGINNIGNT